MIRKIKSELINEGDKCINDGCVIDITYRLTYSWLQRKLLRKKNTVRTLKFQKTGVDIFLLPEFIAVHAEQWLEITAIMKRHKASRKKVLTYE